MLCTLRPTYSYCFQVTSHRSFCSIPVVIRACRLPFFNICLVINILYNFLSLALNKISFRQYLLKRSTCSCFQVLSTCYVLYIKKKNKGQMCVSLDKLNIF